MTERYAVRKAQGVGPRGGLVTMWHLIETERVEDHDGGWCQTFGTKAEAKEAAEFLNREEGLQR